MAQTIPYNKLQIPSRAAIAAEVAPQFEAMRRLKLPGILLPEVGSDEAEAMDTIESLLAALGVSILRKIAPIQSRERHGDRPLHIDSLPFDDDSVGMILQYTRTGGADLMLARLAEPFCEELRQRNAHVPLDDHGDANYDLPPDTQALLSEGLVDPAVLHPDVYVGSVAAGGAVMFTFGGPHPVAHHFISTTPERYAQGYIVPFTRL